MTLTRSHRRLTARAFLGVALLVVLVASWLPCAQALAGDGASRVTHHDRHCGHCPDGGASHTDGVVRAAAPHCVDVAKSSPDARPAASLPAFAPPLLVRRGEPKVRPPDAPGPAPVFLPRSRQLLLEKSVLLI